MFENITKFFRKFNKEEKKNANNSKEAAKERLHLVLMQDRANVSADFLELMKREIIEVIKKYIDVDESAIDVRLTNKDNGDGTTGAPALYANIPITNIKNEARKAELKVVEENKKAEEQLGNKNEKNKDVEEKADNKSKEDKKAERQETKKSEDNNKVQENKNSKEAIKDKELKNIKQDNEKVQKQEKIKSENKEIVKEHTKNRTKEKIKSEN